MSDEITVERGWQWWEVVDRMLIVQHAPIVTDPETGKNVDPTGITLNFRWVRGTWNLVSAKVEGLEVAVDGTHPDDDNIECDFYDPVRGDPGSGKAPDWLIELAIRRKAELAIPPARGESSSG